MFAFKKKYFLIIENTRDINIKKIKKKNKFIIIYRNQGIKENMNKMIMFRKLCKLKLIKFYIANDYHLALNLKSDGVYLSAKNLEYKALNFRRLNFDIIGSAHNVREINFKKKQGCKYILLSRLFKVSYKPKMNFMGINKFNNYSVRFFREIVPLGGINLSNLNKLKIIKAESLAIMSEVKKKPAIIGRLF